MRPSIGAEATFDDLHVSACFVQGTWKLLLALGVGDARAFDVSWLERTVMLHHAGLQMPAACPRTGRWIPADHVTFRPPRLTLAVQLGLIRNAVRTGAVALHLDACFLSGIDCGVLGVLRPQEGLVLRACTTFQDARLFLQDFCRRRPIRTQADLARPL